MKNRVLAPFMVHRFLFGLALLCGALAQAQAVEGARVSSASLAPGDVARTRVAATADNWLNSGVEVAAGREYQLTAKGKWTTYPTCAYTGPDGIGLYNLLCFKTPLYPMVVDGYSHTTLIGKIGEDGTPFAIGESLVLKAPQAGVLYLRINDTLGATGDNDGYVDVEMRAQGAVMASIAAPAPVSVPQLTLAQTAADEEVSRVALVIGNSGYRQSPLKNPLNDATAMANALEDLGFQVILRTDANQREMETAIDDFGRQLLSGRHVALFYFAGHGVQVDGENYLIPVGAAINRQSDVRYKAVNLGQIMGAMGEATDNLNIIMLDACRDNPLPRSFRSSARGLARMEGPKGTIIGFATSPGDTAADGEGDNGVYTKHLLANMRLPGASIEQVFKRVLQGVNEETGGQQTPWTESSFTGNFSFNPG